MLHLRDGYTRLLLWKTQHADVVHVCNFIGGAKGQLSAGKCCLIQCQCVWPCCRSGCLDINHHNTGITTQLAVGENNTCTQHKQPFLRTEIRWQSSCALNHSPISFDELWQGLHFFLCLFLMAALQQHLKAPASRTAHYAVCATSPGEPSGLLPVTDKTEEQDLLSFAAGPWKHRKTAGCQNKGNNFGRARNYIQVQDSCAV